MHTYLIYCTVAGWLAGRLASELLYWKASTFEAEHRRIGAEGGQRTFRGRHHRHEGEGECRRSANEAEVKGRGSHHAAVGSQTEGHAEGSHAAAGSRERAAEGAGSRGHEEGSLAGAEAGAGLVHIGRRGPEAEGATDGPEEDRIGRMHHAAAEAEGSHAVVGRSRGHTVLHRSHVGHDLLRHL